MSHLVLEGVLRHVHLLAVAILRVAVAGPHLRRWKGTRDVSDTRSGRERGAASFSIHNPGKNEGTDILRARGLTLTEVARRREAPRETRRPVRPAGVKSWCVESDVAIGKGVKRVGCARESAGGVNGQKARLSDLTRAK